MGVVMLPVEAVIVPLPLDVMVMTVGNALPASYQNYKIVARSWMPRQDVRIPAAATAKGVHVAGCWLLATSSVPSDGCRCRGCTSYWLLPLRVRLLRAAAAKGASSDGCCHQGCAL